MARCASNSPKQQGDFMGSIERIDVNNYRLPLPRTLSDSAHGMMPDFELIVVDVVDSDGGVGTGYTYTVGRGGSAIRSMIVEVARALVGRDALAVKARNQDIWSEMHWFGRGGAASLALSAVDIALWDLLAKRADLPLWRLLGGHAPDVRCYAGGIDLEFPLAQLLEQADSFQEEGFRAIKMKVGRPHLGEDVERVAAMRSHLGDEFPLMVDVNMGWSVGTAVTAARAMRELNLVWLEEPIAPEDTEGHVRVLREGGVPIATGENFHTPFEFVDLIRAGGVSYPEPDVTNCGGVSAFMQVAATAAGFNLPVTSHGAHDVAVHLLAASPNASYLEMHGFSVNPYIDHPLVLRDGTVTASERPGLGFEFDRAAMERHLAN